MLELKNITKVFNTTGNKADKKVALDSLSLTIHEGEFVTIIGGNGSGKTTTMNIITGALAPDSGKILLNGIDITKKSEHRRASYFGRVFQDPMKGTASEMSALENLEIAYRRGSKHGLRWGFSKKNKEVFIQQLKRFDLGLENRLGQKVGLMSGGQRQALTLLMASFHNPEILLLDEHTAALDPKTARKVMELTDEIVRENHLTTLMITHNMKDAIAYGDRLIMFSDGRIIADFKGDEKKNLTVEKVLELFDKAGDMIRL